MKGIYSDSCTKYMFNCPWIHIKTCSHMELQLHTNDRIDLHKLKVFSTMA